MNMDESPFTRRTGRSSANQRSPALRWICRRRSRPCGPATRSKMAAPTRVLKLYMLSLSGAAAAAHPVAAVREQAAPGARGEGVAETSFGGYRPLAAPAEQAQSRDGR